jgi:hypothetical protein
MSPRVRALPDANEQHLRCMLWIAKRSNVRRLGCRKAPEPAIRGNGSMTAKSADRRFSLQNAARYTNGRNDVPHCRNLKRRRKAAMGRSCHSTPRADSHRCCAMHISTLRSAESPLRTHPKIAPSARRNFLAAGRRKSVLYCSRKSGHSGRPKRNQSWQ